MYSHTIMLLLIIALTLVWFYTRFVRTFFIRKKEYKRLKQAFGYCPETKVLRGVGEPRSRLGNSKTCILMLPGLECFPSRFDPLIGFLQPLPVSYLAPRHPWYATVHYPDEDQTMSHRDIMAFFDQIFQIVRSNYENVILVSHSAGSNISSWLMSRHPVEGCVMISPNLVPNPRHLTLSTMITNSMGKWLAYWFIGLVKNAKKLKNRAGPCDTLNHSHYLSNQWTSVTYVNTLNSMWTFQQYPEKPWKVPKGLFLFGRHDETVGSLDAQRPIILKRCQVPSIKISETSAHNLLQERDIDEILECIKDFILAVHRGD